MHQTVNVLSHKKNSFFYRDSAVSKFIVESGYLEGSVKIIWIS